MSVCLLFLTVLATVFTPCQSVQPSAPSPYPAPLRELPWGQLNILHTTDTHGWHAGHLQEPSFSADWGDYISFAHHMRRIADEKGTDLILVDTGDRVEGNGLYDASKPKGEYTFDIVKHQDIEIICSGNHELYKENSAINELTKTVPNFKGNYLASNIDIRDPESGKFQPLARRYRKFETPNQHIRITAFGFLYDFKDNANNTIVQPVQDAIKEKWFQDAIRDKETDLFLVAGHVAADSEEYQAIYKAIREVQWDIPIQFMAGHSHIRDFKKYDKKAVALESGRYMETIGFGSVSGLTTAKKTFPIARAKVDFKRMYIDNNLFSLQHHSSTNETSFQTELGKNVSTQINEARKALKLDETYGCAPHDFWLSRAEASSNDSLVGLLQEDIIPDELQESKESAMPKLVFTNTGALRFDIFKGPFTRDSTYLVSPFTSGFRLIRNVDYAKAQKLLSILNGAPFFHDTSSSVASSPPVLMGQHATEDDRLNRRDMVVHHPSQSILHDDPPLAPGYTTKDDDGDDGDDTIHSSIEFYNVPNCIQSKVDFPKADEKVEKVDLVYNEFIEPWMILALRFLGLEYGEQDTKSYRHGITMTSIIAEWVRKNWPCDD